MRSAAGFLLAILGVSHALERVEMPLVRRRSLASASGSVDLMNKKATQFFAPVSMDGQTFNVLVDTGSSDLWFACSAIAPSKCMNGTCPSSMKQITYGSGSVCLDPTTGSFRLGSLEIPNAVYGVGVRSSVLADGNQGILGLAFPSISVFKKDNSTTNAPYPIQNLDSFSMYLTAKEDEAGSKLVLNGVDDAMIAKDKLVGYTVPLNETAHWTIEMSSFAVSGQPQKTCSTPSSCLAIIDSGTTFLSMPRAIFSNFATTILKAGMAGGCAFNSQVQYYICPKDMSLPTLTLVLGKNRSFLLHAWDYSWVYSPTEIAIQIQKNPASGALADRWILGDTFLKVYYTAYLVKDQAVTFYCKDGGICNGGVNILDFSSGKPTWAVILMIAGVSLLGISLLGGLVYWIVRRRRHRLAAAAEDTKRVPLDQD
ncbi:Aste57867_11091 [Aphanomyces stellatus]|uniref:Aste57867_11091 protein n=1 Tax=Aphanomyces stellatus TaxID=120398 RepID=A0A485KSQ9_9STRA|nr:hypothetical protein As57867_011049 [Aphanomyces stellatus]VFT87958.1 Aste57867_11091 [Aphanomyces stellatus]